MDTNTIYEAFCIEGGRTHFYQWDTDQKIIVNDRNIDEVHFCNGTTDKSLVSVVKDGKANVPNLLLQTAARVRVYGYSVNHTVVEKVYEVKARTKPEDYVYEETEVYRWAELDKRIQAVEEKTAAEDIITVIFRPNTGASTQNIDSSGKRYKLTECIVEVEYAGAEAGSLILSCGISAETDERITIAQAKESFTPEKKYAAMEVFQNNGYWDMRFYGASDEESPCAVRGMPKKHYMQHRLTQYPYIDYVRLEADRAAGTSLVPEGTKIIIRGVRAKD